MGNKEKRLIDISELLHFEVSCSNGKQYVLIPVEHLSDIPTVDATEVVRCKDCKWRTDCDFYNKKGICVNRRCTAGRYGLEVPDEHFCSYGERKEP